MCTSTRHVDRAISTSSRSICRRLSTVPRPSDGFSKDSWRRRRREPLPSSSSGITPARCSTVDVVGDDLRQNRCFQVKPPLTTSLPSGYSGVLHVRHYRCFQVTPMVAGTMTTLHISAGYSDIEVHVCNRSVQTSSYSGVFQRVC